MLKIDVYPDANFAGMYGYEHHDDPFCVKSQTGYVINVANCPVMWQSKLQTEMVLSTMEAEIVAISRRMVHAWVGQKYYAVNLILRLFLYRFLHTLSSKSIHNNTNTQQTSPPWWWSRLPLQRRGFDDSMPPEGRAVS